MARSQPLRRERVGLLSKDCDPTQTHLRPLFEAYLIEKRAEQTDKSRKDLRYPFELFCRWLALHGKPLTLASLTLENIKAYRDDLAIRPALGRRGFEGTHLSEHSQHAYLRPIRQFADYLAWAGYVELSPFELSFGAVLPNLKKSTRILKLATPEDVRAFLHATCGDDPLSLRDHALLMVAWETGMRTQDLVGLDLVSLDSATGLITILDSKGDKDRQVMVGADGRAAISRYLRQGRPLLVKRAERRLSEAGFAGTVKLDALFLSEAAGGERNRDGRLTENGVYQLLQNRWQQAGRQGGFGAHRFRHGLATLLTEANVSLDLIAQWLGDTVEMVRKTYSHPRPAAMHRHIGPVVAASLIGLGYEPSEAAARDADAWIR
jgi:site-specific recombinase XerD